MADPDLTGRPRAAIARSPSVIAAEIQMASSRSKTPESAVTKPPVPRLALSLSSTSRSKLIGPRFEATTTGDSIALGVPPEAGCWLTVAILWKTGGPAGVRGRANPTWEVRFDAAAARLGSRHPTRGGGKRGHHPGRAPQGA